MHRDAMDIEGTPKGRKTTRSVFYKMTPKAQKTLTSLRQKRKNMKYGSSTHRPTPRSSGEETKVGRFSIGGARNK